MTGRVDAETSLAAIVRRMSTRRRGAGYARPNVSVKVESSHAILRYGIKPKPQVIYKGA
ncbi:hypothetical protein HMPREF0043_00292 [Actinobaculum sp. oral taxon 183 str. F0552]|nr:hypothetical protein HMPREF0043_00292 [Actinobaculum sp. oral taxon 183 str. F0552]